MAFMYRLLIVEDESWIRMGLETIINWPALDVKLMPSAANGEEALMRVQAQKPDIVLTDIRMPQMDGLELMRRLHEKYPEIMIIVISGYDDFSYAQKAIQYGAFSYVLKPIEESGLESEIRRCIREIEARKVRYAAVPAAEAVAPAEAEREQEEPDGQAGVRAVVSEAAEYIVENLADPDLSLSGISAALHTNYAYLSHAFKKDMNLGVTEYIMHRRIELARKQLATDMSLQQVAEAVGYPNFQYFIRVFKKVTGTTPAQYRKTLQKQK